MFWFVTILLFGMICAGAIGLAVSVRMLKFGEEVAGQHPTLRIVLICFIDILAGRVAVAAVLTRVIDPLVAIVLTLVMLLLTRILVGRRFPGTTQSGAGVSRRKTD